MVIRMYAHRQNPINRGLGESYIYAEVFRHLAPLAKLYPAFENWYWNKAVRDAVSNRRRFFLAFGQNRIQGVVIAKRTPDERKLCTVWICPTARQKRIAEGLVSQANNWLGSTRPLITIPENRLHEFRGLISRFGFVRTEILKGYYRCGQAEHVFNGKLRLTCHATKRLPPLETEACPENAIQQSECLIVGQPVERLRPLSFEPLG